MTALMTMTIAAAREVDQGTVAAAMMMDRMRCDVQSE